jgi:hypothetical protein
MKRIGLLFITMLSFIFSIQAQDTTAAADATVDEEVFSVRVLYESALIRELPSTDARFVASVFENDVLQAIGRNADGSWLQVRRPGRDVSLGWIAKQLVIFTFDIIQLPLTDFTTGVTGSELIFDSGVSVFILTESNLRAEPFIDSAIIGIIPIAVTIPASERNLDERWIKVNYLGTSGWVVSNSFSTSDDLTLLPVAEQYNNPAMFNVAIIPPEVQLAQVYRMLDFLEPTVVTAAETVAFWNDLQEGIVIACYPPQIHFTPLAITTQDLYELPELRTAARRLQRGLDDLNASIAAMQRCGVYTPREISEHYAEAVNAHIVINAVWERMLVTEQMIMEQMAREPNP